MKQASVVLITGCSMGSLGATLAEEFAKRGCTVYASARNPAKMEGLSSSINKVSLDALSDSSVEQAVNSIIDKEGRIDILYNSVGGNRVGALLEVSVSDMEKLYQTNVFSTVRVIKAVAPHMISQHSGLIINSGSIGGNVATPWYGPYSSSKAALHSLTETFDMELRPFGIKVMLLALGMIHSNIGTATESAHDFKPSPAYYDTYRRNIDIRLGQGTDVMPAEVFARKTVDAALSPSPPPYLSFGGQATGAWVLSLLPRSLRLNMLWKAYSDKTPKV